MLPWQEKALTAETSADATVKTLSERLIGSRKNRTDER